MTNNNNKCLYDSRFLDLQMQIFEWMESGFNKKVVTQVG